MFEKGLLYAVRFDLQPPSLQKISTKVSTGKGLKDVNYTLISLPLYAVELLPKIIEEIRNGKMHP